MCLEARLILSNTIIDTVGKRHDQPQSSGILALFTIGHLQNPHFEKMACSHFFLGPVDVWRMFFRSSTVSFPLYQNLPSKIAKFTGSAVNPKFYTHNLFRTYFDLTEVLWSQCSKHILEPNRPKISALKCSHIRSRMSLVRISNVMKSTF